MAQDNTVQERIETILYAFGITNSGSVAEAIWEEIKEDQVDFIAQEVALRRERENLRMFLARMRNDIVEELE